MSSNPIPGKPQTSKPANPPKPNTPPPGNKPMPGKPTDKPKGR